MSQNNLETKVKKQAQLLEEEVENLLEQFPEKEGKFIAYFNGEHIICDTHEECFKMAEKKFGKQGFAIAEITAKKELVVSALIKV